MPAQRLELLDAFDPSGLSAVAFARCEGTIPAPESAHAIHSAMVHALKARESGEKKVIVFNLSGHGLFDMAAYDSYLSGTMIG